MPPQRRRARLIFAFGPVLLGFACLIPLLWFRCPRFSADLSEDRPPNSSIPGFLALGDFVTYDSSRCEPCTFTPRNRDPDSTAHDCVMATMFNMTYNLVPFVRSLRTTGSRCQIVFIVDAAMREKIDRPLAAFLAGCGCTLITTTHFEAFRNDMLLLRSRVLVDFLRPRVRIFDRIVVVDLYDTIFQGDPFWVGFDRSTVGFSLETRRCDRGQIRCAGYLLGDGRESVLWQKKCVNIGTILGAPGLVLRFLEVYVDFLDRIPKETLEKIYWIPDQVILNSIIYTNQTGGVPIRFYENFQEYHIMIFMFNLKNISYELGEYRALRNGTYPFLVHLYDRSRAFSRSVRKSCPQTFPTADPYIRVSGIYK
jgi:hypothetical protein